MSSRNSSPRRMNLTPDARGRPTRSHIPTEDEIRAMFGPARTLGAPEDACVAMDSQLADSGVYSLLQHSFQTGIGIAPQFMGYGALQNIAQNGLIRACVETVADDMTRAWIELKREGSGPRTGEDDELLTELAHAADSLELQRIFHEAAELVGYEGGAFIFIDTGVSGRKNAVKRVNRATRNPLTNRMLRNLKCRMIHTVADFIDRLPTIVERNNNPDSNGLSPNPTWNISGTRYGNTPITIRETEPA